MKEKTILAIDTSCDDTSAAIVKGRRVLSNIISSQEELHKKYGGVMPSLAKLEHSKRISNVVNESLKRAGVSIKDVDLIGVTKGPGLAISLEVGLVKADELAKEIAVPIVEINHMEGHLLSSLAQNSVGNGSTIDDIDSSNEWLGLLISGGHTEIVYISSIGEYKKLGQTLDDACGEAFDKCARVLGLGYPGGAALHQLAKEARKIYSTKRLNINGTSRVYLVEDGNLVDNLSLPVPMSRNNGMNMSFSGLKTAFWQLVRDLGNEYFVDKDSASNDFAMERKHGVDLSKEMTYKLALIFEEAATEHLLDKVEKAYKLSRDKKHLLLGGGVVNNTYIRSRIRKLSKEYGIHMHVPYSKKLFIDNAAMIGIAAAFKKEDAYLSQTTDRDPIWDIEEI